MNKCLLMYATICLTVCSYAQNSIDNNSLLDYFEECNIPTIIGEQPPFRKELPYNLVLNSFFNGDEESTKYKQIATNMEDPSDINEFVFTKAIVPCYYYYVNNCCFIIYLKTGERDGVVTNLSFLKPDGTTSASLALYYVDEYGNTETISKLYGEVIYTFEYITLFNSDSANNATQINIKSYTVDYDNYDFVLQKNESIFSPIEMYQFDKHKEEPDSIKAQDPFYKY